MLKQSVLPALLLSLCAFAPPSFAGSAPAPGIHPHRHAMHHARHGAHATVHREHRAIHRHRHHHRRAKKR